MHITNISEAKAQLSALIERVLRGEEVIIGKAGMPVARLVKYERYETERRPGALASRITIADDFDRMLRRAGDHRAADHRHPRLGYRTIPRTSSGSLAMVCSLVIRPLETKSM